MRRALLVVATLTTACSEPAHTAPPPADRGDGGVNVLLPAPHDASRETDDLVFVDEADTACVAIGGAPTSLSAEGISIAGRSGQLGGRRWISDAYGRGVAISGEGEHGPDRARFIQLGTDHHADSTANVLGIVGSSSGVVYARYAPNGDSLGSTPIADVEAFATIVGQDASHALVAWATGTAFRARAVDAQGNASAPFDLEVAPQSDVTGSISAQGASFAVAWSVRRTADGRYRTYFVRATPTGTVGVTRVLHESATPHGIARMVRVASGFVLVMNMDGQAVIAPLDALGRPRGPARRLVGSRAALDVASRGSEVAIVARRTDDTIAVRAFDEQARPVAGWTCTEQLPEGEERGGTIHADGAGWALIARGADGAQHLHLLDRAGRAR